ncbi:MAG: SMI1/KNR4 family protein, partial [Fuerstia sp.]|nr:SMI1/KNR4 family protein [Fuerstiella sp.]
FENVFGSIPTDYRWYLATCGGGVIGSEWVDDITQLKDSHLKFSSEGWTMNNVFVIGWDGGGNPMGIDRATGRILVEDHDFGGIHVLANSFADFVLGKK